MQMKWRSLFAIGVLCGFAASASAAPIAGSIFSPVGATVDSGGTADPTNSPIGRTFDQSGLVTGFTSGSTDWATYFSAPSRLHLYDSEYEWFSDEGESSAEVTFDLGQLLSIDRLALWNEDSAGIGKLNLLYSADGLSFLPLLSNLSPANNPTSFDYEPEIFSFGPVSARYVQFVIPECWQGDVEFLYCSIGEVAFRITPNPPQRVPEPATLALFGVGLAGVGVLRRRRC